MLIKKTYEDEIGHTRTKEVYSKYNKDKEKCIQSRKEQVLLAQIRSGKHIAFRAYPNRLNGEISPDCPLCGEGEHTMEQWFTKCPGTLAAKNQIYGERPTRKQAL